MRKYREEVRTVAILEYSAERHLQYEKEDSYNSGYNTGYDSGYGSGYDIGNKEGHSTGIKDTTELFSWLKKSHRESDILKAVDDPNFLELLFEEFYRIKQ